MKELQRPNSLEEKSSAEESDASSSSDSECGGGGAARKESGPSSYTFLLHPQQPRPPHPLQLPARSKSGIITTNTARESSQNVAEKVKCRKEDAEKKLDTLELIKTIGTGTFGRVVLVKERRSSDYYALKILALPDLIRLKQVDHVKNEKNILQAVNHPFIVNMMWHGKDEQNIYMMFEYVCGGELFSYLRSAGSFQTSTCLFYAAEIVLALEYLHSRSVVYRDLKPENLLVGRDGHIKLTDFGFAKQLRDRTWTLCGTPEYLAPEVIQSKGHNKAVDWWALGVLIYEMHTGHAPFYDDNQFSTYEKILQARIDWPRGLDPTAKDLIRKLLVPDRIKRLGCMKNGAEDIKRHRWFRDLSWEDVLNKRLTPPILPSVAFEGDTKNFDDYPEIETWRREQEAALDDATLKLFEDF